MSSNVKRQTSNSLKVVAAIPCYNTAKTIADVVAKTKLYVDDVVVIDDGSKDKTALIAKKAGAKVIKHLKNKGYGGAIQSCFEAAKIYQADILVIIDGDGQHNPHEIPGLLSPIINQQADVVIGSRFLSPSLETQNSKLETRNSPFPETSSVKRRTSNVTRNTMPPYRRFGIGVITYLWNFGSKIKVTDSQSGFRAYNIKMIKDMLLSEKGMSSSIEILEKLRRNNIRLKEAPITCSYAEIVAHLTPAAALHGLRVAFSVIRIRLSHTKPKA